MRSCFLALACLLIAAAAQRRVPHWMPESIRAAFLVSTYKALHRRSRTLAS